jgi:hypothetical protein
LVHAAPDGGSEALGAAVQEHLLVRKGAGAAESSGEVASKNGEYATLRIANYDRLTLG